MIFEVDSNADGVIGFFEFCNLMIRMMKDSDIEDELVEIFKIFDKDGNGQVSPAELKYVMTTNLLDKINDERIKKLFANADVEDLISKAD